MIDDIVTRLREVERLVRNSQMDCDDTADLIEWCADEIERLRAERTYYEEMALHLANKNFDANEEIHRLEIYLKAVRGD
jgi:uncharacterized protein YicC (UPF0701 family)